MKLNEIEPGRIACRDLGHRWRPYVVTKNRNGYTRTLECMKCSTFKHTVLDWQGYIVRSWYDYRKDYRIEGLGPLTAETRAAIRLANLGTPAADTRAAMRDAGLLE